MKQLRFLLLVMGLALVAAALPLGLDPADAGPGTNATDAAATPSGGTFFANSPILRKFVDSLPGLGPANANNLGQYIPVATPGTLNGGDYYEIALVEYREQMHSDLPPVVGAKTSANATGGTKLRGYVQELNGVAVGEPHYLGPLIVANRGTPVRVKFTNRLPTGAAGNLFLPVDTTLMGAGMGNLTAAGAACDPMAAGANCANFTENRAVVHLHGGRTPWISDGTPRQWVVPSGETTPYLKGISAQDVPDMPVTVDGEYTYYYSNEQSSRLMFYHDHAEGLTRLNVYAGEAAGYIVRDPAENTLIANGIIPSGAAEVPLIIQDKTFVPQDIAVQDAKWDTAKWGQYGDLWFPHVYETNQWLENPDGSGTNPYGRWDYGPWFWPIFPVAADKANIYAADVSHAPESFMDTSVVNGTAYPYLTVDPKAYRFRILNACNDRFLNLQLYYADPSDANGTEVKMVTASPRPAYEVAAYVSGEGTSLMADQTWTNVDTRAVNDMFFLASTSKLYATFDIPGLWEFDGASWTQIFGASPVKMVGSGTKLYASFASTGVLSWDGGTWSQVGASTPTNMAATNTAVYLDYGVWGLWKWDGASLTQIATNQVSGIVGSSNALFVNAGVWGVWKYDGTSWAQIDPNQPVEMVSSGANLYISYGPWGLWKYDGTGLSLVVYAEPALMSASSAGLYVSFGAWGLWAYDGANFTYIDANTPDDLVATANGCFASYGVWGIWKYDGTGLTRVSSRNPDKMVATDFSGWPALWPVDGRDGGVPDPLTAGPKMIQIGNESGFLPAPAVLDNQPINYEYFRRSATVLNVIEGTLYMGPAERADVIIDFSQVPAGSKVILYNDGPAPNPGFDSRFDYYTGNGDQTAGGGAPSTVAGFGPNTRTIMQFRVSDATPAAAYDLAALQAALPVAYAASQAPPAVGESAYNTAFGTTYSDIYGTIFAGSSTQHTFDFVAGRTFTYIPDTADPDFVDAATPVTKTAGQAARVPVKNKALIELFDEYGRMNSTLGTEIPFTSVLLQTAMPFKYIDPPTESIDPGEVQIWKVTHNGVDTHAIHFHLMDMQLINRVGWDGTLKPPHANELGWKETIKMNPLEDIIIAVHAPTALEFPVPFAVPNSSRLLDPLAPAGTTAQFTNVDPTTGVAPVDAQGNPAPVTNVVTNFGWEYVWHCHLLGHEENDMMRPFIYNR